MNPRLILGLFLAVSVAQLATPIGYIRKYEDVLQNGTSYKFPTAPVDPYDAFRGKYVALNFADTWTTLPEGNEFGPSGYAYVSLRTRENGFVKYEALTLEPPASGDYLRVDYWMMGLNNVRFSLPFNRFYMEESMAPRAERAYLRNSNRSGSSVGQTYALVRVKNGRGVIEDLFINDQPVREFIKNEKP